MKAKSIGKYLWNELEILYKHHEGAEFFASCRLYWT